MGAAALGGIILIGFAWLSTRGVGHAVHWMDEQDQGSRNPSARYDDDEWEETRPGRYAAKRPAHHAPRRRTAHRLPESYRRGM